MKKQLFSVSVIAICLLSSCAQTPENIEGANHNIDLKSTNKVSVEHILDDFDEAFKTEYTKFKLPDKSSVIINQPEGVYDLELKYVNSEKSLEWLKEKVFKLAEIFNVENNGNAENIGNIGYCLENDKGKVRADVFSEPYYCTKDNMEWDLMNVTQVEYIDRINPEKRDKKYKNIIEKAQKLSNEINSLMDGALINNAIEIYIKNYKNKIYYDIYLQPTYKGLGIQCITPTYSNGDIFEGDNALMTMSMYMNIMYDSDLNLIAYISSNNYTPVKEEVIDKLISFKGACDILEEELASNVRMEFDDVKLWYEPRGTILDATTEDGFDGSKTTKCTPKWFFISDNEEDSGLYHAINYVTVDCVTGEIEVFFPG